MKYISFYLLQAGLLLALLTFNNCGGYQTPNNDASSVAAVNCTTPNCVLPTDANLKVTPHLGNGEYAVPANLAEFNIGGDCNEGGYPYNLVHWELLLNGVIVRTSAMNVAGTSNAETRCVNGRFFIYVNLVSISQDPVDRTGLKNNSGVRSAYDLNIEVIGLDAVSGGLQHHAVQGKTRVPLTAI